MKPSRTTETTNKGCVDPMVLLLDMMDEETRNPITPCPADRALWHLLKRWKSELPFLNDRFHKNFRQIDVTNDAHTDMAIWQLLSHSKIFWRLFEQVRGEENPRDY